MEVELVAGETVQHEGKAFTVVQVLGSNVLCKDAEGKQHLIPVAQIKGE